MISTEARDIQFYTSSGLITNTNWFTWNKPKNAKFIMIMAQGAGGGGGRTADGVTNTGGQGGGSGASLRAYGPAHLLPDVLYISPGIGGLGATVANTSGEKGSDTFICVEPITTSFLYQCISGYGGGIGNAAQTTATAQTVFYGISSYFINQALPGTSGRNGATGTNSSAAGSSLFTTQVINSPGGGGGNGTGSGASLNGNGIIPTLSGGAGTNGGNGRDGFGTIHTFKDYGVNSHSLGAYATGGTGGGGHTTGTAGKGGNGGLGSGGGGGGGCNNAAGTSGNGGNGGNGYVFIMSY